MATRDPGFTGTFDFLSILNDGIVTSMVYVSGRRLVMTKSPVAFVTAGFERVFWDSLMSVTVAPGSTPPDASVTVPATVPVVTCAFAADTIVTNTTAASTKPFHVPLLVIPPLHHHRAMHRTAP